MDKDKKNELQSSIMKDTDWLIAISEKQKWQAQDKVELKSTALRLKKNIELMLKTKSSTSIDDLMDSIKELKAKIESSSSSTQNQHPIIASYADAIINKQPNINKGMKENTIVFKAKPQMDANDVQNTIIEAVQDLRNKQVKSKVNKIIRTKTGVIIKTPATENIDELIEKFQAMDKLSNISSIYKAKPLDPTIILNKVSKLTDLVKLPLTLCSLNSELSGMEEQIKVVSRFDRIRNENQNFNDVIIRISPQVYQIFKKLKFIFIDYECITWRDKVLVKQCQNCFAFNPDHKSHECKKDKHCFCGNIGKHNCSKNISCINCKNHSKYSHLPSNHKPNSPICPLYKTQENYIIQKNVFQSFPQHK